MEKIKSKTKQLLNKVSEIGKKTGTNVRAFSSRYITTLAFKTCGTMFFVFSVYILVCLIELTVAEWPLASPVDISLYRFIGFLLIFIIFGSGYFWMKKWLIPVLVSGFACAVAFTLTGFGSECYLIAFSTLAMFIATWRRRKYLSGSYAGEKSFFAYEMFAIAILMLSFSSPVWICGSC